MDLSRLLPGRGERPESPSRRFIAYYRLVEACDKLGCPACRCLRELTTQSLEALLYEQVTDPTTRKGLDQSWGVCAWHAAIARTVPSPGLGIAIIYETLVHDVRTRLAATQQERSQAPQDRDWRRLLRRAGPSPLVRARAARHRCALCAALERTELDYLRTALDAVATREFEQAYARSVGLCLPHLTLTVAHFPRHRGADALLTRAVDKLDRLAGELRRFIDKHDYRAEALFTPEEGAAWTTALGFLAGEPGVFGNEVRRPLASATARPPDAAEPAPAGDATSEGPRGELERLSGEKARLEARLRAIGQQLGDESSRAAGLHYRLSVTTEDRKVLEMNLAGERAAARTWERMARELQAENEELKARLARREPPPVDAP